MLARAATKPKLSLAVPTLSLNTGCSAVSAGPKSPFSLHAPVATSSPLTPTTRNTKLNQKGFSSLQVPSSHQQAAAATKKNTAASKKSVQFSDASPSIRLVSPMPRECYGEYVKMSREERRWTPRQG